MKVSCPGCNRAYKVDDGRVSERGLKMKCPGCSELFFVAKTGEVEKIRAAKPQKTKKAIKKTQMLIRPQRPQKSDGAPKETGTKTRTFTKPPLSTSCR